MCKTGLCDTGCKGKKLACEAMGGASDPRMTLFTMPAAVRLVFRAQAVVHAQVQERRPSPSV